ncbi:MAG: type I-E CRISPR-associated protein Cse1/CasA [Treponema sp.]
MTLEKVSRFNLIDEQWIPVAGVGNVSLKQIFSDSSLTALGGNPVQKISVFKLLLAIAQSACTPKDEAEWEELGCEGMKKKVLAYLEHYHDCFFLYGEKPFLQMPEIEKAAKTSFGSLQMQVATGNTSVVTQIQAEKKLSDAEKAMLVLNLMGFALGGKKVDNSVVLTAGYTQKSNAKGKPATGKPGPAVGFMGLLHSFFFYKNIIQSVYNNLFTEEQIMKIKIYSGGVGTAPWICMPKGEDDDIAKKLKQTYMGRLVPVNRFVLLAEDGVHYSEGIFYPGYAENVVDASVSVDFAAKPKPKVLWVDPERKPWRQITSLLSFLNSEQSSGFVCYQLKELCERCKKTDSFSVWSGGVKISNNAGEQFLKGNDDFVESEVQLSSDIFGSTFFENLSLQMGELEIKKNILYGCVMKYFSTLLTEGKNFAEQATGLYWQLAESSFQQLVNACECPEGEDVEKRLEPMIKKFNGYVLQIYNQYCPNQTARQLESWAKNKPFSNENKKISKEEN